MLWCQDAWWQMLCCLAFWSVCLKSSQWVCKSCLKYKYLILRIFSQEESILWRFLIFSFKFHVAIHPRAFVYMQFALCSLSFDVGVGEEIQPLKPFSFLQMLQKKPSNCLLYSTFTPDFIARPFNSIAYLP